MGPNPCSASSRYDEAQQSTPAGAGAFLWALTFLALLSPAGILLCPLRGPGSVPSLGLPVKSHLDREAQPGQPLLPPWAPLGFSWGPHRRSLAALPLEKCARNMSSSLAYQDFSVVPDKIAWRPDERKLLFPLCTYGALSNQLGCMRIYFHMAGLLNRTLVLPAESITGGKDFSWRWDVVFGFEHMRECLKDCCGERAVLMVKDWLWGKNDKCVNITRTVTIDHMRPPTPLSALSNVQYDGVCFHSTKVEDRRGRRLNESTLEYLRGLEDQAISLDVLMAAAWVEVAPFNLKPGCQDLWDPHEYVLDFVNGFTESIIGEEYAAMHLRRRDFSKSHPRDGGFMSVVDVAKFVAQALASTNVSCLYLATDGSPMEVSVLEKLVLDLRQEAPLLVVRLPSFKLDGSAQFGELKWVSNLAGLDKGVGGVVKAIAEKYICARAKVFIGTPFSTFSDDIVRIRRTHGWASCYDGTLHKQRKPSPAPTAPAPPAASATSSAPHPAPAS